MAIICWTSSKLADRLAEGLALVGVLDAGVEAGAGEPDRAGADGEAALVDAAHGDLEALALLADAVLDRDADVVEGELAGVASADAQLALDRAGRETLHAALEHEGGRDRCASSSGR